MNMKNIIISYILTFIVFLAVDMIWLGVIAKKFYQKHLGSFLSEDVNWVSAFVFYFLFVIGVSVFVIYPAVKNDSLNNAILFGALFGFIAYATYDLTNLATLKNWPLSIVIVDMIWGAVLTSIVSLSGYIIIKWIQ